MYDYLKSIACVVANWSCPSSLQTMKTKYSLMVILFAIGIILAVVISSSAIRQAYRSKKIESEVNALQEEARRIQSENERISQRISYYSTPHFIEKVSKDKISLQKPDENVIIVSQRQIAESEDASEKKEENLPAEQPNLPNYIKWWRLFF